jgi:signal transduction histidine kinase
LVFWAWLSAAAGLSAAALWGGAEPAPVFWLLALSAAPSLAGFILLTRFGAEWADLALIGVWLFSVTLSVFTAGPGAPLAVGYLAPLALTLALGRPWTPGVAASALALCAAAWSAAMLVPLHWRLGPWPQAMAFAYLVLGARLATWASRTPNGGLHSSNQRIAEVSHELRTPLTHILGFAELIEREIFGPLDKRYAEYAGLIRKSGSHLLNLVNDILDLSKLDAGRYQLAFETFDVRSVVHEVVQMSELAAEAKSITLACSVPDAPLMVRADEGALRRILINTLGNAIKFTPEQGRVALAARAANGRLVLDTMDSGPGISEAERGRLGRAFERGAAGGAKVEGAGLGLSLVRALAAAHGGALSFHDAQGGGALVRVTLPVLVSD